MMRQNIFCAFLLVLASNAWAGNEILADKIWLHESVPGQTTASLQLSLTVTKPGMLLAITTPMAEKIQIQQVLPRSGRVTTHVLRSLRLSRDRSVSFGEHGLALMLVGLKAPLSAGSHIPVTLTVRTFDGQMHKLETQAEVRPQELSYKHYQQDEVHDH